jgi:hypothetical protein
MRRHAPPIPTRFPCDFKFCCPQNERRVTAASSDLKDAPHAVTGLSTYRTFGGPFLAQDTTAEERVEFGVKLLSLSDQLLYSGDSGVNAHSDLTSFRSRFISR